MRIPLLVAVSAGLLLSPAALADDPRVDGKTGQDLAVYPPDRHFDHLHMRLEIDIPDMAKPEMTATETLTVAANGKPREALVLDAGSRIKVESVTVGGQPRPFTREDQTLTVRFDPPAAVGQKMDIVFRYRCDYPKADGTGLTWTAGKA